MFTEVRDIVSAERVGVDINTGLNNNGISVVTEDTTGEQFICKKVRPGQMETAVEVAALEHLRGHEHIVQLRQFNPVSSTNDGYDEIIMEYCRAGNTQEVNTIGQLLNKYFSNEANRPVNPDEAFKLPELFVWEAFEGMLKAMCFMHLGLRDVTMPRVPDWKPVAHRDVHMGNIFVSGGPDADAAGTYPRIVLGDFGLADWEEGPWDDREDFGQRILGRMCQRSESGQPSTWVYSEDLRQLAERYNEMAEVPRSHAHDKFERTWHFVPLLLDLMERKKTLLGDGSLKFEPLRLP